MSSRTNDTLDWIETLTRGLATVNVQLGQMRNRKIEQQQYEIATGLDEGKFTPDEVASNPAYYKEAVWKGIGSHAATQAAKQEFDLRKIEMENKRVQQRHNANEAAVRNALAREEMGDTDSAVAILQDTYNKNIEDGQNGNFEKMPNGNFRVRYLNPWIDRDDVLGERGQKDDKGVPTGWSTKRVDDNEGEGYTFEKLLRVVGQQTGSADKPYFQTALENRAKVRLAAIDAYHNAILYTDGEMKERIYLSQIPDKENGGFRAAFLDQNKGGTEVSPEEMAKKNLRPYAEIFQMNTNDLKLKHSELANISLKKEIDIRDNKYIDEGFEATFNLGELSKTQPELSAAMIQAREVAKLFYKTVNQEDREIIHKFLPGVMGATINYFQENPDGINPTDLQRYVTKVINDHVTEAKAGFPRSKTKQGIEALAKGLKQEEDQTKRALDNVRGGIAEDAFQQQVAATPPAPEPRQDWSGLIKGDSKPTGMFSGSDSTNMRVFEPTHHGTMKETPHYTGPSADAGMQEDPFAERIKQNEGLELKPYKDAGGWAIGHGHQLSEAEAKKFKSGISKEKAEEFFSKDIERAKSAVQKLPEDILGKLTPKQQGVLVEMAYQMGGNGLLGFKEMLKRIAEGDIAGASKEMLNSLWAKEQTPRRAKQLSKLFAEMLEG